MPILKTTEEIFPQVYAYTTPSIPYNEGLIKIGYTERKSVEDRVNEQTKTVRIVAKIEWYDAAFFLETNEYFHDTDFHRYLTQVKSVERIPKSEWFKTDAATSKIYFDEFRKLKRKHKEKKLPYELRTEQENAVELTLKHFVNGGKKFLWNAKPRFGKTLTAYELIRRLDAKKVLIVTNRPAISNSWYDNFLKFISWQTDFEFMSENDALKNDFPMTYKKYFSTKPSKRPPIIVFESLQNLKGAKIYGGEYDKLQDFKNFKWDLLIVDESHEGVETEKTDKLFSYISRRWTLYLSGTPFKAIANNLFREDEIFNWSYEDEQKAKLNYSAENFNPYDDLPRMNLFSYRLSKILGEEINKGVNLDARHFEYAFDLNEFFSVSNGKFVHHAEVEKFLDTLTTHENFPFSTPEMRDELKHTFWLFQRINSVKAMAKLLKKHPVFKDYEIVIAAGNDADENGVRQSLKKVKRAIQNHDRTITLSVGQLTTGVTIPEWTGVFMLSDLKSTSEYMQAAFRAQNPYRYSKDGKIFCKKNCYVFDFAPVRTLKIYDEFANNLNPSHTDRKKNIGELLNFFPVLAEDDEGSMMPLDAEKILSLPQKIKVRNVIENCFISNFLFVNISRIFNEPAQVQRILYRFNPDETPEDKKIRGSMKKISDILPMLDENGNIIVNEQDANFGEKVFANDEEISTDSDADNEKVAKKLKKSIEDEVKSHLRGFARTIPAFLMAYGNFGDNLTLKNFDDKISDKTFLEVTGVTKDAFHLLRDGGYTIDEETGETVHIQGGYFDEIIFNSAVNEFLKLKRQLADYFAPNHDKDIFDFIPPQRTNQIFTPRPVVIKMVDELENLNPDIFANPNQKFIDIYMKSGMFIAEIVKRIFNRYQPYCNDAANAKKILKHILTRQVFGFAPSEIIYRIVCEYLFGADITRDIPKNNFFCADSSQAVECANLSDFLNKNFSKVVYTLIKSKNRVQAFGEVFTPIETVAKMLDNTDISPQVRNIHTKILEPSFGEGIFLVEILKRRLENCHNEIDILTALSNLYGVELQHDNVIATRHNLFSVIEDIIGDTERAKEIINANLVEGDFLSQKNYEGKPIEFCNWQIQNSDFHYFTLEDLKIAKNFNSNDFKNVVVIGNPPYQKDIKGGNKTYAAPIYHRFLEESYKIADRVLMIHPARFLFNAGGTPDDFNKAMLNDEHLKICYYSPDSKTFFDNVDIKGGIVITYRDTNKVFGAIGTFTAFPELNSILHKVTNRADFQPLSKIIYSRTIYKITEKVHQDYPDAKNNLSTGHLYDMSTNIFDLIPQIFFDNKPNDGFEYMQIIGRKNNVRIYKFIRRDYINNPSPLEKFKVLVPDSNGSGAFGEKADTSLVGLPLVGLPLVGSTETFITVGAFDTRVEAASCYAYIKTKFCRAMLGILKVTQHNPPATWSKVPIQNFRADSDIDWSQSIADIDKQLYKKYGLTEEEIAFIENNVKAFNS